LYTNKNKISLIGLPSGYHLIQIKGKGSVIYMGSVRTIQRNKVKKIVGGALFNNEPANDEIYKKKSILLLQKMRVLSMKKIGSISTFDEVNSNVYLFNLI
jgi:hypothetical protein